MNSTHIVILVHLPYKANNNLEKALFEYAQSIDRKLFDYDQLEVVKEKINSKIEELNNQNKRCKPMEIRFLPGYPIKEDVVVHGLKVLIDIKVVTKSHISSL